MSLKYAVVLVWVIYLCYKVVITGCEVVLVNRNITDSFRVGEDGCTNNGSVCTSSATCQPDGSCLCSDSESNFRNPVIIADELFMYGGSFGCVSSKFMRVGVGATVCSFKPFQVIPYSPKDQTIQFSHDIRNRIFQKCSLEKALAKFPDNDAEMELQWLHGSYINLTVSSKILYFKWTRSATDLQGTIITFTLKCQLSSGGYSTECLRAKVLGIWTADAPITEQPTTYISDASSTDTMTTSPKSSARSNPPSEVSSSDDDSSGTIVIIAVVVPVVLLIVLVVVVWWLCKRKKRNMQGNSSHGSSGKNNGTAGLKQFRHTDSNLRGPDAYADGEVGDTNETFGTDSQVDPGYATPDFKKKEINPVISYPEPGYETPDVKKKEINVATADSAYSTPDKNTSENNADIERVDVNGDLYALPNKNKNTKKINGLNYMDPSRLVSGSQDGNESQDQSGQPTEYAEVVGVMKPAPKKPKTKK